MKLSKLLRTGIAALAITTAAGAAHASTMRLSETGSSLLYPLFNLWVPAYTAKNPDVSVTTASTGSGTGIAQSIKGLVQIGASDAYLSDAMVKDHPAMLSIPLAISSQAINYNLPGVSHLNLSGPILAGIYMGKITKWNDPAIAAANPGVTLPDHVIIPIHRVDGSGDTFIFSQYLAFSDKAWSDSLHYGTAISWPAVTGGIGANGNPGMVTALQNNPYGIAYIGISFAKQVAAANLGQAALLNKAGNYVLPTSETISEASSSVANTTPADERISIVFTPGTNAYPIVNYEYAIVNSKMANKKEAAAVRHFLTWAVNDGNAMSYMEQVHFLPLPASVKALTLKQIESIK